MYESPRTYSKFVSTLAVGPLDSEALRLLLAKPLGKSGTAYTALQIIFIFL
jgi:hypothetical protein